MIRSTWSDWQAPPQSDRSHVDLVGAGAASSKADSAAPSGAASMEGSLREPDQTEQSQHQIDSEVKVRPSAKR